MSGNKNKKNKKSKFLNFPEVLQVKSLKLDTSKVTKQEGKTTTKSEGNLRKIPKTNILKNASTNGDEPKQEPENSIVKKLKNLSLNNEGEMDVASTSFLQTSSECPMADSKRADGKTDDEVPLLMEYCPESSKVEEQYATSYKFYTKNTKSIKFINQVTVLYFNGEDILCESTEPLKKEQDQQIRNKEMRKEHLLSKGQIDNLYLF